MVRVTSSVGLGGKPIGGSMQAQLDRKGRQGE